MVPGMHTCRRKLFLCLVPQLLFAVFAPSRPGRATLGPHMPAPSSPANHGSSTHARATDTADKLARIGQMLSRQGEPDALSHLKRSIHLDPSAGNVWKAAGHLCAQKGQLAAAACALRTAVACAQPGHDLAARTGLATVLAQLGDPHGSADELLVVRGTIREPHTKHQPPNRHACVHTKLVPFPLHGASDGWMRSLSVCRCGVQPGLSPQQQCSWPRHLSGFAGG